MTEPKPADGGAPASPAAAILIAVCGALLLGGVAVSVLGPAGYGEDLDRHWSKALLLSRGEWSYLLRGLQASGDLRTPSGLLYAIMALPMTVSRRPEWLFGFVDAWVLLGTIPLWYLARRLAGREVAWIAAALYAVSSGRVVHSWTGLHSAMALPVAMIWHLSLVKLVERPSPGRVVISLGLLFAALSLHLSFVPVAGGAVVLWFAMRRPRSWAWPGRLSGWSLPVVGLVAAVAVTAAAIGWGIPRLGRTSANLLWAIGEHVGVVSPQLVRSSLSYSVPSNWLMLVPIGLVLVGLWDCWKPREDDPAASRRAAIFLPWLVILGGGHLLGAWIGIPEWHLGVNNVWRYRQLTPVAPMLLIVLAIGIRRLGSSASMALGFRSAGWAPAALVGVLGVAHFASLVSGARSLPWRAQGIAVEPDMRRLVEVTRNRWGYGLDWFRTSVFAEPARPPRAHPTWEYLVDWMFPDRDEGQLGADRVLYLARGREWLDQAVRPRLNLVDSVAVGDWIAWLGRRSAASVLPADPYYLTYGARRSRNQLLHRPMIELVSSSPDGRPLRLVASNVEVLDSLGLSILAEVVVEERGEQVAIGARLYGLDVARDGVWRRLFGPHLAIRLDGGRIIRLPFEMTPTPVGRHVWVLDSLPRLVADSADGVYLGVDSVAATIRSARLARRPTALGVWIPLGGRRASAHDAGSARSAGVRSIGPKGSEP